MPDNEIMLLIVIIILCSFLIILIIQLYRMNKNYQQLKKINFSKKNLRHKLINLIGPIAQLCNFIKKDHNILTVKSEEILRTLIENSDKATKYINNIKE